MLHCLFLCYAVSVPLVPLSPNSCRPTIGPSTILMQIRRTNDYAASPSTTCQSIDTCFCSKWIKTPNKHLEIVTIRGKGINGEAAASLFSAATKGLPRLRELIICGNNLRAVLPMTPALCQMCERCKNLAVCLHAQQDFCVTHT